MDFIKESRRKLFFSVLEFEIFSVLELSICLLVVGGRTIEVLVGSSLGRSLTRIFLSLTGVVRFVRCLTSFMYQVVNE